MILPFRPVSAMSQLHRPGSDRVVLNVGGRRFVTFLSTLRQFPDTLLGTMFAEDNMPMAKAIEPQEYFFDRNSDTFGIILEFYRNGGKIFLPNNWDRFTQEMLAADLDYFQVPHDPSIFSPNPLIPPTQTLEELARTLPAAKRYSSDILTLTSLRADRIMRLYGNILLRLIWLGVEHSRIRSTKGIGPRMRIDLRFPDASFLNEDKDPDDAPVLRSPCPLILQAAMLNLTRRFLGDASPPVYDLLGLVSVGEWAELDWSSLVAFLETEPETPRERPYLREKEEAVLGEMRGKFVVAISMAMRGDSQTIPSITVERSSHRCVVRIEINGDRL